MKRILFVLMVIICFSFFDTAYARETKKRGDYLTVKIAVMGPGDALYFWWGHLGLIVEDSFTGTSRFYDYGVFSFDNDRFFRNFAAGRLIYSSVVSHTGEVIRHYVNANRDVTLYTLNLSAEQKEKILQTAEHNIKPEYRDYLYNHFTDNCVTRVINILDDVLGGQFYEKTTDAPGRFTLREHVRRHMSFSPFFDWLLNFLMGQGIDTPSTVRQEMFLPSETGRQMENFSYIDDEGCEVSLVSSVEIINKAQGRPPVLESAREQWPSGLRAGLFIMIVLVCFICLARKKTIGGVLLGLSQSLLGLFFGLSGSILFFMTFFSDHDYTWHNSNVIFVNPLWLLFVPLGIVYARTQKSARRQCCARWLRGLWTFVFFAGMVTMLLKLFPRFYQQNQTTLCLILPFSFALSFIPLWIGNAAKTLIPVKPKRDRAIGTGSLTKL